jgi:hypothetical protein
MADTSRTIGALSADHGERVAFRRLVWVGPLAVILATAANTLIGTMAVSVLRPDPGFVPLAPFAPALFTFGGGLGAVLVSALVGRVARCPIWLYERLALVALVLSCIPAILIWVGDSLPGTTAGTISAVMVMHVVAWAIVVTMLTRLARVAPTSTRPGRQE